MSNRWLLALRVLLGVVWLYNGLWLKVLAPSPGHLAVVAGLPVFPGLSPQALLTIIGVGETALGVGSISGLWPRLVAWFQFFVLLLMNGIGILFSGAIAEPVHLLVQNLPLFFCILLVARYSVRRHSLFGPPGYDAR